MSEATVGRLPEKGLGLALEILEQVARSERGATAADLARAVDAPRATVYRVVNSLVRDEYLVRRPDLTGFLLGARVLELASIVGANRRPAHADVVDDLRAQTGEGVHLVIFHDAGIDILDEDPVHPVSNRSVLLSDPTRSAVGHLWLVDHAPRECPEAPRWQVRPDPADVDDIAAAFSVRGYAEQAALLTPDRGCLAVPISDRSTRPVGALSLSTSAARLAVAARHLTLLREAADSLVEVGAITR